MIAITDFGLEPGDPLASSLIRFAMANLTPFPRFARRGGVGGKSDEGKMATKKTTDWWSFSLRS